MSNQPTETPTPNANRNKRRRAVEDAATTLRKPFRSPLITRPGPSLGPGPATPMRRLPGFSVGRLTNVLPSGPGLRGVRPASASASGFTSVSTPVSGVAPATVSRSTGRHLTTTTTTGRARHGLGVSPAPQRPPETPTPSRQAPTTEVQEATEGRLEVLPLPDRMRLLRERATRALEGAVRQTEGTRQREEELGRVEGLTAKWRGAGRTAAEELFEVAKRKVKDRGGLKGLERERREAARRTREFFQQMDGFGNRRERRDDDYGDGEGRGGEGYDNGEGEEGQDEDDGSENDEQVSNSEHGGDNRDGTNWHRNIPWL